MKKNVKLLFSVLSIVLCFTLMSNSGGRASVANQGTTGAPGEGTCGNNGCHDDGNFSPEVIISITDDSGAEITEYMPNTTYNFTITNNATGASGYGFQMTALDDNNAHSSSWSVTSSNGGVVALSNRTYVEQMGTSAENTLTGTWSTDVADGNVTFYAASNAVNGNSSPGGDGTAITSLTIPAITSSNKNVLSSFSFELSPNPVVDFIYLDVESTPNQIEVYDAFGRLIQSFYNQKQIDVSMLTPGNYYLRVGNDKNQFATKKFLKL